MSNNKAILIWIHSQFQILGSKIRISMNNQSFLNTYT